MSSSYRSFLCWMTVLVLLSSSLLGQEGGATASVPRLISYSGIAKDADGRALTGPLGVTFALYKDEAGGVPVWLETQNVQADSRGHYTVTLGASQLNGLPAEVFTNTEARWLGVQLQGHAEQSRVMLLAVPYALKAADAETIGGLPPSAFVLATPGATPSATASAAPTTPSTSANPSAPLTNPAVTGLGTISFIPLWDATSDIVNSVLFQSGSGTSAKVGINTTTPSTTLDVKGAGTIRGSLALPATGTATATAGKNSQPVNQIASSFNSSTHAAVNQTFRWQAEPAANNTASPSATLNLLFGAGTASPTETGLKISNTGIFTFADTQTFPGTGTITGVTAGAGMTGGGTGGNVTLGLTNGCSSGQVLQWNGTTWACTTISSGGTITGVSAGTDLTGGGASGNVTLSLDTTQVPQLNTANTFTGNQTVNGNLSATGVVTGSSYQIGSNLFGYGNYAAADAFLGFSGNTQMIGTNNTSAGFLALLSNTSGSSNTAVGSHALYSNTTGGDNVAMGQNALNISQGDSNTAVGNYALTTNVGGSNNTALGYGAGNIYNTLSYTTLVGAYANAGSDNLTNATALGARASVNANNALVLGSINGVNGASADTKVGIGTTTPQYSLDVHGTANFTDLVTFSPAQIFPGTQGPPGPPGPAGPQGPAGPPGPISGVTAGTGLTGGGNNGTVTVSLDTTKVPLLAAANTFTGNQTVNGNLSATGTVTGSGYQIGSNLVAFGSLTNENAFLGFAGNATSTGAANTGVGSYALGALTSGGGNTAAGTEALLSTTTGQNNTASGAAALRYNTTGSSNTADGWSALTSNLTGGYNTATGIQALESNISGSFNTASGDAALYGNTTGNSNTAVGNIALRSNTDGSYNTATGATALQNSTASNDTADGFGALQSNTSGVLNTATGSGALAANTTGFGNTGSGAGSLQENTTGNGNTAVGKTALLGNITGSYNTAIGYDASQSNHSDLVNATAIGAYAMVDESNALILGSFAFQDPTKFTTSATHVGISTTTPTYQLHIGNLGSTWANDNNFLRVEGPAYSGTGGMAASFGGYGDFGIDAPGIPEGRFVVKEDGKVGIDVIPTQILTVQKGGGHAIADGWDTYSSRRWKTNIHPLTDALSKVEQLRGVSYDLKGSGKHEIGVIAEEVGQVVPEIVSFEAHGKDAQGVDYSRLTALLIEATKEQQALIRDQQKQIRAQQAQIRAQQAESKLQQAQIARLGSQVKVIQAALETDGRSGVEVRTAKAAATTVRQ